MAKKSRHSQRQAEIEAIARRIRSGEDGCLYERLVSLYLPYLRTLYRGWRYPQAGTPEFQDLCRGGVHLGFAKWDGTIPLHWKVKNAFRDVCRARFGGDRRRKAIDDFERFVAQQPHPDSDGVIRDLVTRETAQVVLAELRKEKPPCPQVVRLHLEEGMGYREIGYLLRLSEVRCRVIFHENRKAVVGRVPKKHPEILGLLRGS